MLKRSLASILGSSVGRALPRVLLRTRATVLMLHRFRHDSGEGHGHDPMRLRSFLEFLRGGGYEIVGLRELLRRLAGDGPAPSGAIAFTIDDGYRDQAEIGGEVFAAFDCPVTVFVTTGFVDGDLWFWWDRVAYALERARPGSLDVPRDDGPPMHLGMTDGMDRLSARRSVEEYCKTLGPDPRDSFIERLATEAEVELPDHAPSGYAPICWDTARRWEARGMTFGPHTVTHPILSRCDSERAAAEVRGSWARLREEVEDPEPVFCYPNGQPGDYGEREVGLLRGEGLLGAMVGFPEYADRGRFREEPDYRYRLPRFSYVEGEGAMLQVVTGFEVVKQTLRPGGMA